MAAVAPVSLDGTDCTQLVWSGYAESEEDVQLELQVPFWIDANDVHIDIEEHQLRVSVRNTFCFSRTYWTSRYSLKLLSCTAESLREYTIPPCCDATPVHNMHFQTAGRGVLEAAVMALPTELQ